MPILMPLIGFMSAVILLMTGWIWRSLVSEVHGMRDATRAELAVLRGEVDGVRNRVTKLETRVEVTSETRLPRIGGG